MPINHIVLFQFKAGASPEAVDQACTRLLAMKDTCLHPTTQKPYIKSLSGGKNISKDAAQSGIQWGLVAEFGSAEDLEFYAETDDSHNAVKASLRGLVEKVFVTDYTF